MAGPWSGRSLNRSGQRGGRDTHRPPHTPVLNCRTPNWVVAAEIVETSRRFGRTLARIQGDWVERVAPHVVSRIQSEPHWVRATGQVAAWERVQFGELTVVPRRRVPWGPIHPDDARNIFIQSAKLSYVSKKGFCRDGLPVCRGIRQPIIASVCKLCVTMDSSRNSLIDFCRSMLL